MSERMDVALARRGALSTRLREWSGFLLGSAAAQGLSVFAGLLLARWLSVGDYAIFTVATTMLGAMTVLTKGGAHLGFTAILGRMWPDEGEVERALEAALRQRRLLSCLTLPALITMTLWLLTRNGATSSVCVAVACLLIICCFAEMHTSFTVQILYFAQRARLMQMIETGLAGARLGALFIIHVLGWLGPVVVILTTAALALARVAFADRLLRDLIPGRSTEVSSHYRDEIRAIMIRQVPTDIFYCLQSQMVYYIIGYFGNSALTADVGALSRIGQLLLPFQSFMIAFAITDFARAKEHVARSFCRWALVGLVPGAALVVSVLLAPRLFLDLLGSNYDHLDTQLAIAALGAAVLSAGSTCLQMVAHRGWNRWAWLQVPCATLWLGMAPFCLDLRVLSGLLWLQAGLSLGPAAACGAELLSASRRGIFTTMTRSPMRAEH